MTTGRACVLGPATLDRYPATGEVVPGGPALNVAWHWTQLGRAFDLISRIGDDGEPVIGWLHRHVIATTDALRARGRTCSIDIDFGPDRQPIMTGFDPGVWDGFALTDHERALMLEAVCTHAILTEAVIDELLAGDGTGPHPALSADFLTAAHVDADRFERLTELLDVGFVGWPGDPSDGRIAEMEAVARSADTVLVVTFGARGVLVVPGRSGARRWFDVDAVEVAGTSVGCGDAFIAGFLDRWLDDRSDLAGAVGAGAARGAAATAWHRALPPDAY